MYSRARLTVRAVAGAGSAWSASECVRLSEQQRCEEHLHHAGARHGRHTGWMTFEQVPQQRDGPADRCRRAGGVQRGGEPQRVRPRLWGECGEVLDERALVDPHDELAQVVRVAHAQVANG